MQVLRPSQGFQIFSPFKNLVPHTQCIIINNCTTDFIAMRYCIFRKYRCYATTRSCRPSASAHAEYNSHSSKEQPCAAFIGQTFSHKPQCMHTVSSFTGLRNPSALYSILMQFSFGHTAAHALHPLHFTSILTSNAFL